MMGWAGVLRARRLAVKALSFQWWWCYVVSGARGGSGWPWAGRSMLGRVCERGREERVCMRARRQYAAETGRSLGIHASTSSVASTERRGGCQDATSMY